MRITASSGLSEEEIKRMQREAETHRAEDEERKKLVEARNQLDGLTYTVERTLRENGTQLESDVKQSVEATVQEAKKHLESRNLSELKQATENLIQVSQRMSEQLYRSSQAGAAKGDQNKAQEEKRPDEKNPDDVIDADFKEVG